MPARSKTQKKLMSWALADKEGKVENAPRKVKEVAKKMSKKELEKFAKTKKKDLPEKVAKVEETNHKYMNTIPSFEAFLLEAGSNEDEITSMTPDMDDEGDSLINIKSSEPVTQVQPFEPEGDHHAMSDDWAGPESKMAQFQLKNIIEKAEELIQLLDGVETLEDWVQAKLTVADNYISNVRDFIKHS